MMTKTQKAECLKLYTYKRLGMTDVVARALSALIRACMTAKQRSALMAQADVLEVIGHPEFIV